MSTNDLMFKNKYLKYKTKYLELKEQEAGMFFSKPKNATKTIDKKSDNNNSHTAKQSSSPQPSVRQNTVKNITKNSSSDIITLTNFDGNKVLLLNKKKYEDIYNQFLGNNNINKVDLTIKSTEISDLIMIDIVRIKPDGQNKNTPTPTLVTPIFVANDYNSKPLLDIREKLSQTVDSRLPLEIINFFKDNIALLSKEEKIMIKPLIHEIFREYSKKFNDNSIPNFSILKQAVEFTSLAAAQSMSPDQKFTLDSFKMEEFDDFRKNLESVENYFAIIGTISVPKYNANNIVELPVNVQLYIDFIADSTNNKLTNSNGNK